MEGLSETEAHQAHQALADLAERRWDLRLECESAVVRWQWAAENSDLHRPGPLYHERYGLKPPKLLDEAPAKPRTEQRYGLDANDEIRVAHEYTAPGEFREELRVRRGDSVVGYRWTETGEGQEVNIARFDDRRLNSYVTLWPEAADMTRGWSIERYAWDGDRLDEIDVEIAISFDATEPLPQKLQIRPSYDATGRLVELRQYGDRGEKVLFRAKGSGPSTAALHRPVEDRLVELLPELVREHADEPIYAVALHYHLEWPLPPNVAVGLERDRSEWMQTVEDPETLWFTVWNPAEFSSYRGESLGGRPLTELDPELARAIAEIPEDTDESREHGRATLNRVAKRLNQLDWTTIAPVTDDFVVYAVDLELTDLADNLKSSVPAALRNKLAVRGLLNA